MIVASPNLKLGDRVTYSDPKCGALVIYRESLSVTRKYRYQKSVVSVTVRPEYVQSLP
jgi:hypothetical protein